MLSLLQEVQLEIIGGAFNEVS